MNNPPKKRIIIADLRSNCSYKGISTGHYIPVAKMYQSIFAESFSIRIAGGPVYKQYFNSKELIELPYNVCGDSFLHKVKLFKNSIFLFQQAQDCTFVIQQASDITVHLAIALFYRKKDRRLFLIRYSTHSIRSSLGQWIYSLCSHKIDGILCPNNEIGTAFRRPYISIPDYIYLEGNKKTLFGKKKEKKYDFCIVGRISEEKGVIEVARWAASRCYHIIIAGKPQTTELEQQLHEICDEKKNVELKVGYLSDDDYGNILADSKYVFMNYQGEYSMRSSGVIYDTLFAGVPVIGTRCKALDIVNTYQMGYLYDSLHKLTDELVQELLTITVRNSYTSNIDIYRRKHIDYLNQLKQFITN